MLENYLSKEFCLFELFAIVYFLVGFDENYLKHSIFNDYLIFLLSYTKITDYSHN